VCEAVSVEKGARRPPLPTAVVCPPGRRRRRRLAITAVFIVRDHDLFFSLLGTCGTCLECQIKAKKDADATRDLGNGGCCKRVHAAVRARWPVFHADLRACQAFVQRAARASPCGEAASLYVRRASLRRGVCPSFVSHATSLFPCALCPTAVPHPQLTELPASAHTPA
jgi:hypothetical protein